MRNAFFLLSIATVALATACSGDTFAPTANGGVAGSSGAGGRAGFAGNDSTAGAAGVGAGGAGAAGEAAAGATAAGAGGAGGADGPGGAGGSLAGGSGGAVAEGGTSGASGGGAGSGGAAGGNAGQGGAAGGTAGQGGAAGGTAGQGGVGGGGAGGAPPLDCPVLYVSPDGKDTQLGCSAASPMRTLNGALLAAKDRAGLKEIRVCQGVFEEPALDFDRPLALRGGYTCGSFERTMPVMPDKRTVVMPKAGIVGGFTLRVGTDAVALDGFEIRGPLPPLSPTGNAPQRHELGAALVFAGGTKADVRDTTAVGAKLAAPGAIAGPTAAAEIKADAAPTFTRCRFEGGDGSTDGTDADVVGSVGVLLRASGSRPRFSATSIDGGGGKGISLGSVGILSYGAKLVGTDKLTGAVVNGGAGRSFDGNASVALLLLGGEVEVEDTLFDGGSGRPTGANAVGTVGIAVGKDVKLRLSRARVYGGDVAADAAVAAHASVALQGYGASELLVVNSVLHGGGGAAPPDSSRSSYALVVAGVATTHVGFTTLVGSAGTTGGAGVVVRPHEPSAGMFVPSQSVTIDGSLFLVGSGIGFLHEQSSTLPVLRGNAFATGTSPAACKDCTSGSKFFIDAPDEFGAFPGSEQNLLLLPAGSSESAKGFLPLCGALATCGAALFDGFGGPSSGKAGVADKENGYKLKANLPCAFLKLFSGGGSANTPPTTDAFGSARTSAFSPGASEQDNCKQ